MQMQTSAQSTPPPPPPPPAFSSFCRADWEAEKYGRMDSWVNIPLAFLTEDGPMKNPQFLEMIQQRFPDPNTPLIIVRRLKHWLGMLFHSLSITVSLQIS